MQVKHFVVLQGHIENVGKVVVTARNETNTWTHAHKYELVILYKVFEFGFIIV